MFNILFSYLAAILTPTRLRQPKFLAWIALTVTYLKTVYDKYIEFREQKMYLINFTGQTMYLEKYLQDVFDCPGIFISDGYLAIPFYLYNSDESYLPVYVGNLFSLGSIYKAGNEVIYQNYFYEYTNTGNGSYPDSDPSAVRGDEIETYIINKEETTSANDFIVNVPSEYYNLMSEDDLNKMHSIINYYKLVNKTYSIKSF